MLDAPPASHADGHTLTVRFGRDCTSRDDHADRIFLHEFPLEEKLHTPRRLVWLQIEDEKVLYAINQCNRTQLSILQSQQTAQYNCSTASSQSCVCSNGGDAPARVLSQRRRSAPALTGVSRGIEGFKF